MANPTYKAGAIELDGTLITTPASAINLIVSGAVAGLKMAAGTVAATATETVATGLTSISEFILTPKAASAASANYCTLITGSKSGGNLTILRFKPTSATRNTLVAATSGGIVNWVVVGA